MTSARPEITHPRVRKLGDSIIEAQVKEIAVMDLLLKDIEENGEMGDGSALPARTTALTTKLRREAEKGVERPIGPSVRDAITDGNKLAALMVMLSTGSTSLEKEQAGQYMCLNT